MLWFQKCLSTFYTFQRPCGRVLSIVKIEFVFSFHWLICNVNKAIAFKFSLNRLFFNWIDFSFQLTHNEHWKYIMGNMYLGTCIYIYINICMCIYVRISRCNPKEWIVWGLRYNLVRLLALFCSQPINFRFYFQNYITSRI